MIPSLEIAFLLLAPVCALAGAVSAWKGQWPRCAALNVGAYVLLCCYLTLRNWPS